MDEVFVRDNELLAAFLDGVVREGWRVQDNVQMVWEGNVAAIYREAFMRIPMGRTILTDQLKFHESWDWLMPVVEKIRDIDNQADEALTKALWKENHAIFKLSILAPLHVVYGAVIDFIKWHNERTAKGGADT